MENYYYEKGRDEETDIYITDMSVPNSAMPHFHKQAEIMYCESDSVDCNVNGKSFILGKGDVLFCDSYDIHGYNRDAKPVRVLIVPNSMLGRFEKKKGRLALSSYVIKRSEATDTIRGIMVALFRERDKNSLFAYGCVQTLLGIVLKNIPLSEPSKTEDKSKMLGMLKFISENYLSDIRLSDIAKNAGYSEHYCSRMFNRMFSVSITEYINMLRAQHAAELIKSGEGIIEAAMASGFNSVPTFYRNFIKIFGKTPGKIDED